MFELALVIQFEDNQYKGVSKYSTSVVLIAGSKEKLPSTFKYLVRASVCKYRIPGASCEIFNFFIFCLNKPFSELFSKIQLKVPKAL